MTNRRKVCDLPIPLTRTDGNPELPNSYKIISSKSTRMSVNDIKHPVTAIVRKTDGLGLWTWTIFGDALPGLLISKELHADELTATKALRKAIKTDWSWSSSKGFF